MSKRGTIGAMFWDVLVRVVVMPVGGDGAAGDQNAVHRESLAAALIARVY